MHISKKLYISIFVLLSLVFYSRPPLTITDSSKIYTENAISFKKIKSFDKAIEAANKALILAKKSNKQNLLAESYFTLGVIQIDLKKYDDAIENLIRSFSYSNTFEPSAKLALTYYNLGICYLRKNNYEKSDSYFNKANAVYDNLNLFAAKNMVNLEKSMIYIEKGKINEAENTLNQIITSATDNDSFKILSEVYYLLGTINAKPDKLKTSISYLTKAYEISTKNKDTLQVIKISKKLSEIYEQLSLTNNSLFYLKKYTRLKDSIGIKQSAGIVSSKMKVDDVLRSMEKLDKEKKEQERANKFSKLINILSIALITILSLLSLSLYKNNIIRNKSNELLQEKNQELEIAKARIEKASKARAEFLSTVSHELRTPLNAINGISHILLEDNPKKSQIEYLKSLKFSGNYLLTYINDILEINRIESKNIEVEKINFSLNELLYNIQNSLKEQASQNNNDLNLHLDSNLPKVLIGDPTKLSQIFINLINNALKFTQNGKIDVNVVVKEWSKDNCSLYFDVTDTGIGIPEDKLEKIFESFSQGSVEINRKYGGTGLGLTIVKKLINLMGGKIYVESKVGVGSKFYFQLPFEIGTELIDQNPAHEVDDKVFINKKVLLVEDNKINQMITKKIVEKKLMKVELCETGEDAIEMVQNNKYDLVLMDVHLPGINGTIATEEIRKFDNYTPIIALTAISLNENREMLMSFGMNDVITKPFNPDVFYKTIETNLLRNL